MLYYDFDKICAGEIFDESGLGNNGMSRGRVVIEPGYNEDNGVELSDGFIQLDGINFKVGEVLWNASYNNYCHLCNCYLVPRDKLLPFINCNSGFSYFCKSFFFRWLRKKEI